MVSCRRALFLALIAVVLVAIFTYMWLLDAMTALPGIHAVVRVGEHGSYDTKDDGARIGDIADILGTKANKTTPGAAEVATTTTTGSLKNTPGAEEEATTKTIGSTKTTPGAAEEATTKTIGATKITPGAAEEATTKTTGSTKTTPAAAEEATTNTTAIASLSQSATNVTFIQERGYVDDSPVSAIRDFHIIQSRQDNRMIFPGFDDDVGRVLGRPTAGLGHDKELKTILLWNPFQDMTDFGFGLGQKPFIDHECPEYACTMSDKRRIFAQADAVVFNTRHIDLLKDPEAFPKRANQNQLMVFFNLESPIRVLDLLKPYNDVFNLTMTYRLDSDIPLRHLTLWPRHPSNPYDIPTATELALKTGTVVWIISRCTKAGSNRWQYVQELSQHVDVKIYGLCGEPCPPTGTCENQSARSHKFYLSLENSHCKDYFTEKLYKALSRNIVPIVYGGLDYDRELPPKSVIKLSDFESPKHLAIYLKFLAANDEEYLKYFDWKRHYTIAHMGLSKANAFCHLCQILHDETYPTRSGFDSYKWWNTDANCTSVESQAKELGITL